MAVTVTAADAVAPSCDFFRSFLILHSATRQVRHSKKRIKIILNMRYYLNFALCLWFWFVLIQWKNSWCTSKDSTSHLKLMKDDDNNCDVGNHNYAMSTSFSVPLTHATWRVKERNIYKKRIIIKIETWRSSVQSCGNWNLFHTFQTWDLGRLDCACTNIDRYSENWMHSWFT